MASACAVALGGACRVLPAPEAADLAREIATRVQAPPGGSGAVRAAYAAALASAARAAHPSALAPCAPALVAATEAAAADADEVRAPRRRAAARSPRRRAARRLLAPPRPSRRRPACVRAARPGRALACLPARSRPARRSRPGRRAPQDACRQGGARAAARLLQRLTAPTADATREVMGAPTAEPRRVAEEEAAAAAALADADALRARLRATLAALLADPSDEVRVVSLHAVKQLARVWAAEPAARVQLAQALGAPLGAAIAKPSIATKALVDRTVFWLLLGSVAAAGGSPGPDAANAALRALGGGVPAPLSEHCTRRLVRVDAEETEAEDELDAFY